MSLPKEPRQKMINIMYLVLTALLAINISAEILNAFKTIDESLKKTNTAVNASSAQIFKSLTEKKNDPSTAERAGIWHPKAEKVMGYAAKAYNFIEDLRKQLIAASSTGGKMKENDQNSTTRILVKEGKGKELFKILEEYKKNVLGVDGAIDTAFRDNFSVDLTAPDSKNSKKRTWEEAYFYMSPTVGALSILSKFQNDIRTSENKVVTFCHEQVGKVDIVFDSYAAIVGTSSNYVMPGQTLTINAGVGAYSKAAKPTISIGGASVAIGDEGFAVRDITAGGPGSYSVPVRISYFNQTTGKEEVKDVKVDYVVGSPGGASVALDKMNVLYIGVDNPITIASSVGLDKTTVAISGGGGSLSGGNGKYIARVSSVSDDCTITVTADGKPSSFKFRVRTIPEAQAYVGGQPSGASIAAGAFKAQGGVGAGIKNFPFELSYDVVSFTFTCDTDDDIVSVPVQGAAFSGAVRNAINTHVKADRMVTIDDIRVKGPDGRTTKAPSLVYYIK
jgi:gliding motility-associated protein GldM